MTAKLSNPDYNDCDFLVAQIARESATFSNLIQTLINDTDSEFMSNNAWLGTLRGADNSIKQVTLKVSQNTLEFIDEND